jgi:AraC family transcriptional regulator, activator of mtrCDE
MVAGDIVLLIKCAAYTLHDGGGERALPLRDRQTLNLTITENDGTGDKLDMLCGRFVLSPAHERILRDYLPRRVVVNAADRAVTVQPGTAAHVAGLVSLMRAESAAESLGMPI